MLVPMVFMVSNCWEHLNNHLAMSCQQHIRVISEGSCDTEDWSNDAENSALIKGINYILKYIQIQNSFLNSINILTFFKSNKCSFDEHKKHKNAQTLILFLCQFFCHNPQNQPTKLHLWLWLYTKARQKDKCQGVFVSWKAVFFSVRWLQMTWQRVVRECVVIFLCKYCYRSLMRSWVIDGLTVMAPNRPSVNKPTSDPLLLLLHSSH